MRALWSTILVMMLALVSRGQDAPQPKPAQPSAEPTKLDVIQKQLSELTLALQALQASDKSGENSRRLTKVENEVLNLKDAIARLESAINSLKTDERRSFYGYSSVSPSTDQPKPSNAAKPISEAPVKPTTVGTLKLVNSTNKKAQVAVNNTPYTVEAGQTVTIPGMPTGEFHYEVMVDGLGLIQSKLSRQLGTAETFTIYIYPR